MSEEQIKKELKEEEYNKRMRIMNEKTLKRQYKKVLKELRKCQKATDFAVVIRDGVIYADEYSINKKYKGYINFYRNKKLIAQIFYTSIYECF